jgi:hypothetical protein
LANANNRKVDNDMQIKTTERLTTMYKLKQQKGWQQYANMNNNNSTACNTVNTYDRQAAMLYKFRCWKGRQYILKVMTILFYEYNTESCARV